MTVTEGVKCVVRFLIVKCFVKDPVEKVALASSNLQRSIDYWNGILGLKIYSQNDKKVVLGFADDQAKLELEDIGKAILSFRHHRNI
jgi:catechol-2,3-dioxygenase